MVQLTMHDVGGFSDGFVYAKRTEGERTMAQTITLDELIDKFEALLFDSDGVLARWPGAVPGAPEAIDRLNSLNKTYFVLTNDASALPETRAARYRELGLDIDAGRIITAGSLMTGHFSELGIAGSRCVVLGTEDSADYVRAAGGLVVSFEDNFDVLVIGDQLGFPFLEATGTVLTNLFRQMDRGETSHLVLPNPDVIYPEGDGYGFASGAVALMFEAAMELRYPGRADLVFTRLGKPHPAMFEEAFHRSGTRDAVMIGDTPSTDIRGANHVGIASVLMGTGVAIADASMIPETDRPTYLMSSWMP